MFAAIVTLTLTASALPDDKEKPLPEAAQKELKKFGGKWKAVKAVVNGNDETGEKEIFIEFKDRKLIVHDGDKVTEFFGVAAVDPSTDPKLLDLKALVDEGPITKGTGYEAIYNLAGDDLSIAIYFGEGKKRPDKLESKPDSMVVLITLKREKK